MPDLARIEAVVFLQSVDIFSFCKAEEILRIAAIAKERRFGPGEEIYRIDDPADTIYCVVQGAVTLSDPNRDQSVGPLRTFGFAEILSDRLRTHGATAQDDTLVLAIAAEDFFDLLANNIDIVKALFRHLTQQGEVHAI